MQVDAKMTALQGGSYPLVAMVRTLHRGVLFASKSLSLIEKMRWPTWLVGYNLRDHEKCATLDNTSVVLHTYGITMEVM